MRRVPDPRECRSPGEGVDKCSLEMIPRVPTRSARPGDHCLFRASPADPGGCTSELTRNGRSLNAVGTEAGRYRLEDTGLSERS